MNGKSGKKYWRSLNELADTAELRDLVEREFPARASEWLSDLGSASRRSFLKIMGASMALAGLASCRRWPVEELAPYAHRPANRSDGVPVHYATAYEFCGMGVGVLATSFDGRPIKTDGNPSHPLSQGASDKFLQAAVLNLYDPDRSRSPVFRNGSKAKREEKTWADFAAFAKEKIKPDGAGMVVLTEASRSPSVAAMRKKLSAAKWFEYEAISNDNQRAGAQAVFGRPLRAVPDLSKAAVILSIDADLFQGEPLAIKYNRDFAAGRKLRDSANAAKAEMNRLYVIESSFTLTGSIADHRRGVKPSYIATAVSYLSAAITGGSLDFKAEPSLMAFFQKVVEDIKGNTGKAVVIAGHRQPPEVHAAVAIINAAIKAPVDYYAEPEDPRPDAGWTPHSEQIKAFAEAAKTAETLLIIGANPVLTAPADLGVESILEARFPKHTIHAGHFEDETAKLATWHVPLAHFLEAWGDTTTYDGTVGIAQPLIEPIFGGKSVIELLALLSGKEEAGQDIVKDTFKTNLPGRFTEWNWKQALFNGIIENTARQPETVKLTGAAPSVLKDRQSGKVADLELTLTTGHAHDGRFANNGWLIELPDPMTRVSWDNPALVSPETAQRYGLASDDCVTLAANGKQLEATIYVLPGMPNNTIALAVGYGRKGIGAVADNVGCNAYALTSVKDPSFIPVSLTKIGDKVNRLACVQDHHIIDTVGKNRMHAIVPDLVVEGTFNEYRENPQLGAKKVLSLSMFDEYNYDHDKDGNPLHKWGMAIDLTVCTGCSACVVACQSENNIPIVGKEMVYRGREMHWLRIDRYFKWPIHTAPETAVPAIIPSPDGIDENETPQAVHQPILCMHCENAPCEEVCPVGATTHSHEGLNMMTYNRCIGTRYCSNNCPYKVRRFNFFDYNSGTIENLYTPNLLRSDINELYKMSKNPDVTIRARGVMEKCTYCVQRIEGARIRIRSQTRGSGEPATWKDGTVVTACQQACPTDAIIFGDLNDKNSRVAKFHALAQSYGLLDPELNTKPRTQYLAKVRNPIEKLDAELYETEAPRFRKQSEKQSESEPAEKPVKE